MKTHSLVEGGALPKRVGIRLLTIVLWLVASLLALVAIFALRELAIWGAALLFSGIDLAFEVADRRDDQPRQRLWRDLLGLGGNRRDHRGR